MKSRKDLNREYQERVKPAGVFQVKNTANGKAVDVAVAFARAPGP